MDNKDQAQHKVEQIARLARIEITEDERRSLGGQFAQILEYVDALKQVPVEGVPPMRGLHKNDAATREDRVVPSALPPEILRNAPARKDGMFKIPKVIE
ncbi:MAG: Asp-tRNA(Asn)/Glu-tRNA(Gln) amidotransferase subunit GatC [Candidatus Omnitrophica bacterium]|nr:Asp-tRNA(Asn)/Glu-tRNA(Gln) amidotransferase subunit GatC [Candidatus Omnitrophota bacterium]